MSNASRMMKLLVYGSGGKERQRLLEVVNGHTHRCTLETVADLELLKCRLRKACAEEMWLVLITTSSEELHRVVDMADLIHHMRSVIVLPDHRQQTIVTAHMLYPRYLSYLDGDFSDIGSVLTRVLHHKTPN